MALPLVAYGDSSSESEVEEEQGVVEKRQDDKSDVRKLLGVLPPPKENRTKKHPVRIALPTLQTGDDSDDEETSAAKRPKTGGSGLTALLPQPKAGPKNLGGGKKPTTTHSMVPYTLSKRKQDSIKSAKAKAKAMRAKAMGGRVRGAGEESDSDEEPTSFFSHLEGTTSTQVPGTNVQEVAASAVHHRVPVGTYSTGTISSADVAQISSSIHPEGPLVSSSSANSVVRTELSSTPEHPVHSSFPPLNSSTKGRGQAPPTYSYPYAPPSQQTTTTHVSTTQASNPHHLTPDPAVNPPQHPSQWYPTHSTQYTMPYSYANQAYGTEQYPEHSGQEGCAMAGASQAHSLPESSGPSAGGGEVLGGAGPGLNIDNETLRRLAGGSMKRRGKEEALKNILDVQGDDVMENIRVYQRLHGDDPAIVKLYKPDTTKLKTPSGMQKRKHQITWLAHEAKERDLELQKTWAQAAQARRDTRAKYGF